MQHKIPKLRGKSGFLRSSKHFNSDTVFAFIVSLLYECVHGFNNIPNQWI